MAELKNYVIGLVTILFFTTCAAMLFSSAMVNNAASGGNGTAIPFPLLNQTEAYSSDMSVMTSQLANGTTTMASTDPTQAASGLGVITQAGAQAITLAFSSLGMVVTMVSSAGVTLVALGVPSFIIGFGIMMLALMFVFAILAAVFKWWI